MIPFNKPIYLDKSMDCIQEVITSERKLSGDGKYTKLCNEWIQKNFMTPRALLTTSATSALEEAAMLIGIKPGDEVIMPSYTFVSTANAFVIHVDIPFK